VILPEFKGGVGQINQLRTQAGLGLPLPLISGRGNYFGLFVVGSIHEGQTVFWPDGTPRRVEFSVTIKKYNEIGLKIGNFNVSASGLLGALL
jgi:phage protein U